MRAKKANIEPVIRLMEHVEWQRQFRESQGPSAEAPVDEVRKRATIMGQILDVLAISAKELQTRLGVNRTTWERWRKLESTPSRSHLEHLKRLIDDGGEENRPTILPSPLEFLSESPCTYGQLRILFFHSGYHWRDAVFHFKTWFTDSMTLLDMASLALNGCSIVYMVKTDALAGSSSIPETIVKSLVKSIGRNFTNRALGKFCFLELTDEENKQLKDFGVLNYWARNEIDRVGYLWIGNDTSNAETYVSSPDVYKPKPATDPCFDPLRREFVIRLNRAFSAISSNRLSQDLEYKPDLGKYEFKICMVKSINEGQLSNIHVYV